MTRSPAFSQARAQRSFRGPALVYEAGVEPRRNLQRALLHHDYVTQRTGTDMFSDSKLTAHSEELPLLQGGVTPGENPQAPAVVANLKGLVFGVDFYLLDSAGDGDSSAVVIRRRP
jgi:hypothetical protein